MNTFLQLLVLFAVVLAGCGGASSAEGDTETSGDTESVQDTESDGDTETVWDTQGGTDVFWFDTDTSVACPHPKVQADCTDGWCTIPAGCFTYGSIPSEPCRGAYTEDQVYVTLSHPFVIAKTEVTQGQWTAMGLPNPMREPNVGNDLPVGWINWFDALAYLNALSIKEGLDTCYDLSGCTGEPGTGCPDGADRCPMDVTIDPESPLFHPVFDCPGELHRYDNWYECPGYRLPTAAEIQYAARAGTKTATYNGPIVNTAVGTCDQEPALDPIAWYCHNAGDRPHPVGQLRPNAFGLHDILGNMTEWADGMHLGLSLEYEEGVEGPLALRAPVASM